MPQKHDEGKRRYAATPEARERQIISDAYDLAEQQIRKGTASSQVITHFLKIGSEKEKLEKEKLKQDNLLTKAKIESLASAKKVEEMYAEALTAMRTYTGRTDDN